MLETIAESLPDILAFAASRSGRFVIAACGDGSVRLYDTDSRVASPLAASTTPVISVAITPDDRFAIAGYADGTITWWRTRRSANAPHDSFTLPQRLPGLRRVELSANGRWMVAFDQSCLWLWDLATLPTNPLAPSKTWNEPIPIRGHTQPVLAIAFSRDARWLVVGSEDRQTRLYDLHAEVVGMGQCILKGHQQDVCAIAIAPDRSWIATGSYDSTIRLWDFTNDNPVPLATLTGHSGWISALTALDQHTLISGGYDQRVYLWDVAALRATGSLTAVQLTSGVGAVRTIAASDDSRFLAILGGRSLLQLWRIDPNGSAELLDTTDAVPLAGVAFDRAGRLLQATRATLSSRTLR